MADKKSPEHIPLAKLKSLGSAAEEVNDFESAAKYFRMAHELNRQDEDVAIKYFRALCGSSKKEAAVAVAEDCFRYGICSPRLNQMYAMVDTNTYSSLDCLSDIARAQKTLPEHSAVNARASIAFAWHNDLERAAKSAKSAVMGSETPAVEASNRQLLAKRFFNLGQPDIADWICRIGRVGKGVDADILFDRLIVRTGNASDTPTTRRLFDKLLSIDNYTRRRELVEEYVDFKWRFDGPNENLVILLDEQITQESSSINNRLLLMKISLLMQINSEESALSTLQQNITLKSKFRSVLAVAKLVDKYDLERNDNVAQEVKTYATLYDTLARSEETLRARLSDNARSIAVVGNSGCEVGRSHGHQIDQYTDVVRFNRFNIDPPYDKDYGTKTTILVRIGADKSDFELPSSNNSEKSMIIISSASILYRGRAWRAACRLLSKGHTLCVFPPRFHIELTQILKGSPSSGISFVYLLRKLRGDLFRKDFFGFSFVDQIESEDASAHYFEKARPSFVHQWHRERELFDKLFNEA